MTRAAVAVLLAGCGSSAIVVQPVFEGPVDDDAAAATDLDSLTLAVAHAGSLQDVVSQTFAPDRVVDLTTVPFADDLVVHLTGQLGGNDVAYGRTCSFALAATGPVPEPHLFFSRNVKFASLGVTSFARVGGVAVTYHDGSAVMLGGTNADGDVRTVERFDPRTGELHAVTTPLEPRNSAVATMLGIGDTARIAMIGGAVSDGSAVSGAGFVELLEIDTTAPNQIEEVADSQSAMARTELTATTLTDGRIIVVGGRVPPMGPPSDVLAEITDGPTGVEIHALAPALAHARAGHTATRLGDDVGAPVLIAGGVDAAGMPIDAAELFKPLSGDLSPTFARAMVVPRSHHQAKLMPDGSVLFIGGVDSLQQPVRTLERFTLDAGFVSVGELPALAGVVDMSVTTLPDGRILIAGGRTSPTGAPITDAFIARLDVIDGSVDVVGTDKLALARAGHQATLLCDGTVLVSGGIEATADVAVMERYNPPALGRR